MNHPTTNHENQQIRPDADLGLAMLVAEDEEGGYEPVAVASTLSEAYELAASDIVLRMKKLNGQRPGALPGTVCSLGAWPTGRIRQPH